MGWKMTNQEVLIKWKGQVLPPISLKSDENIGTLKKMVQDATGVETKNQKLFLRGKILNDNEASVGNTINPGDTLMLMGTATSSIPQVRTLDEAQNEMSDSSKSSEMTTGEPCGLVNLGNTCYMNSVIQVLKFLPIDCWKNDLSKSDSDGSKNQLVKSFCKLLQGMDKKASISPIEFLLTLRKMYPQFSEKDDHGMFSQQDAEECAQVILNAISGEWTSKNNPPFVGELRTIIERGDSKTVNFESFNELTCHISQETTDLLQGLKSSMSETIQDTSETIKKHTVIEKSPEYLFVRFMRFFWKQKEQVKAKILKKVKFPRNLDIRELLSENSAEEQGSLYELVGVLTHCGRSADSGHYIAWTKDKSTGVWWKMDDDKATAVKEDEIMKLDGGGDWHMAYMCLYKKKDDNSSST